MTRARVKDIHDKVNSILSALYLDTNLDGMLLHSMYYVSLGTSFVKEPKKTKFHGARKKRREKKRRENKKRKRKERKRE
jgi:hypothetical protein